MKGSVEVSFDVDVVCEVCRRSLEADFSNGVIYIEPCENCMTDEYRKGAEEAV